MSSHGPVFPPEIFGKIIEVMEHQIQPHTAGSSVLAAMEEQERMATLHACALVCKAFAHFTRPYFFRQVKVGFNGGSTTELRLHRLLQAVDSNPDIERHVRGVGLDFEITPPGPLMSHRTPEELNRCINFLLNISNLYSISLSYSCSTYNIDDYLSTPDVTTLCERMIETYAGLQSRLRFLHAKKIRTLPLPTIYACKALQTLSLDRCPWPELKTPLPQLRTLILRKMRPPIPLSTFLYLPNLENLSMEHADIEDSGIQESWTSMESSLKPPFGLLTLSFNCYSDGYGILVAYLQYHAQKHNKEPLSFLTSLSTRVDQQRKLMPVFRTIPSIRHLNIQVGTLWERVLRLTELNFEKGFARGGALTALTSLNLYVTLHFQHKQYGAMIESLPLIFTSIAPDNHLRDLCLRMDAPVSNAYSTTGQSQPPNAVTPLEVLDSGISYSDTEALFWSGILLFLRNCTNFPRLQTLTLELFYYIPPKFTARTDEELAPSGALDVDPHFPVNINLRNEEEEDCLMVKRLIALQKAIVDVRRDITATVGDSDCILNRCLVRVDSMSGTTGTIQRCATIVLKKSTTRTGL